MSRKNSLFITLEGGEGAGKTTLLEKLQQALSEKGYEVVATREPGGTKLGNMIRKILLNRDIDCSIGNYTELMLFLAARTQHIEELIEPALEAGKIVICDRFNDSTIAYQGAARDLGVDKVEQQCFLACHGVLPELTFFLDLNPEIGLERTKKINKDSAPQGTVDRIEAEKMQFHQKVRSAIQQIAVKEHERILTIDAERPAEEVFTVALKKITETLLNKGITANV